MKTSCPIIKTLPNGFLAIPIECVDYVRFRYKTFTKLEKKKFADVINHIKYWEKVKKTNPYYYKYQDQKI